MSAKRRKKAWTWREERRRRAWALHRKGWTNVRIAEAFGVTPGAVSQWLATRRWHGETGLAPRSRRGQGARLATAQLRGLPGLLRRGPEAYGFFGPLWTAPRVARVIARQFGVRYHPDHVRKLLQHVGWSFQKVQPVALEHNARRIRTWVREAWPTIKARAEKEGRILVFLDESGFCLTPMAAYSWSPRGTPLQVRGKVRGPHLSVIGAMTAEGRLFLNVHRHACHGHEVVLFLRHLLFNLPGRLLILWDRGSIHKSRVVIDFLTQDPVVRIAVERFPAYAPEVDPQEYVWRNLKYDDLVNRTTYTLDALEIHLRQAAQRLRGRVATLINFIHHAGLDV